MITDFDVSSFMYVYSQQPVKVKILKEISEYTIGETVYGPFHLNSTVEIPRWQALVLIKQDAAQPLESLTLDVSHLETTYLDEQQNQSLQPLPHFFYMHIKTILQLLREHTTQDTPLPSESRVLTVLNQFIDLRLTKIFRLLRLENPSQHLKEMTGEERWLFEALHRIISGWRSQLLE